MIGIDEIGEQDDQRAPLEPRIELGQAEREIGLLVMVVELGGRALDAGEARHAADRAEILPDRRVEAVGADEVAALQRDPGQHQPGIDRVIEPRDGVDRLEHEIAGIEGHDDLVIALGAELLAQELAMAGRMLPVDEAAVEAGRIFAQRLELGALARLLLRLDAVDRLLREELQRRAVHAAHVGQDVDGAVDGDAPGELDQPERPAPAQPDPIDASPVRAAAARPGARSAPPRPTGSSPATISGRLDLAALLGDQLETRGPAPSGRGDGDRDGAALADIELVGHGDLDLEQPRRERQQDVGPDREQDQDARS